MGVPARYLLDAPDDCRRGTADDPSHKHGELWIEHLCVRDNSSRYKHRESLRTENVLLPGSPAGCQWAGPQSEPRGRGRDDSVTAISVRRAPDKGADQATERVL